MAGIAGRIPDARIQQLPATPHMQTLERPELVAEVLDAFLPAEPAGAGQPEARSDVQAAVRA
jgi:hypothetical protein